MGTLSVADDVIGGTESTAVAVDAAETDGVGEATSATVPRSQGFGGDPIAVDVVRCWSLVALERRRRR